MNIKRITLLFAVLLIGTIAFTACQPAEAPEPEVIVVTEEVEVEKEVEVEVTRIVEGEVVTEVMVVTATPDPEALAAAEEAEKKILRIAYGGEIDVLNAFTSQNLCDIMFTMNEGLIMTDENQGYVGILAKDVPTIENGLAVVNDDGTVDMTWNLQEGVRWHDGEPFTAEDICFTWAFVTSEGSETYNSDEYMGIYDCEVVDDYTAVMHWDGIYGYYAGIFEATLPEHLMGDMTTVEIVNYEPYNRGEEMIGTGPFKFGEWKSGEYIRVVRNDDYWRGSEYPRIDEIVFQFLPDTNTRLNAMLTGDYHWGQIEPTQVSQVAGLEGFNMNLIDSNVYLHFDFSVQTEHGAMLFSDADVRRALYHAIDREAIAEQLMEGTVTIAHTPINPANPYHNPNVYKYAYDPELAKSMLDDLGWVVGADGIREKDGERFTFYMLNRASRATRVAIAQVIQAQMKEIGVEVTFETLEGAAATQRWRDGEWEGIVAGWFLPADPSITSLFACGAPNNMTGLCDPEVDLLLKESDKYLSFADRKPLLDEAQDALAKAALSLPIYHNVIPQLVSKKVGNFKGSGTNLGSFWNVWEWTLDD
jgi:peptide/nickel transport system substrate-binding protein